MSDRYTPSIYVRSSPGNGVSDTYPICWGKDVGALLSPILVASGRVAGSWIFDVDTNGCGTTNGALGNFDRDIVESEI